MPVLPFREGCRDALPTTANSPMRYYGTPRSSEGAGAWIWEGLLFKVAFEGDPSVRAVGVVGDNTVARVAQCIAAGLRLLLNSFCNAWYGSITQV
ncbi:hypothetical protein LZ554_007051 [Drepanopeziza brunnea f. sp. 'monogermtubi']|nr:hypothetical protein LZ554_007051 [Drepanopeziza brunnea f. sp. 'monogermtubi']